MTDPDTPRLLRSSVRLSQLMSDADDGSAQMSASNVIQFPVTDLESASESLRDAEFGAEVATRVALDTRIYDVRRPRWVSRPHRFFALVRPRSDVHYLLKRLLDFVGAIALLVLLAPLMLAIAVAIKLSSPGPVMYRSIRRGLGGGTFACLKFRTMQVDADRVQNRLEDRNEAAGPVFKIANDPRVTGVGRFLRATALDELPQLFNVLRREMSLVGPRPLPLRDCAELPMRAHRRHVVLPGMTGLWQTTPGRHGGGADIIDLDLRYIDTWTIWSDVRLVFVTLWVILRRRADG